MWLRKIKWILFQLGDDFVTFLGKYPLAYQLHTKQWEDMILMRVHIMRLEMIILLRAELAVLYYLSIYPTWKASWMRLVKFDFTRRVTY